MTNHTKLLVAFSAFGLFTYFLIVAALLLLGVA